MSNDILDRLAAYRPTAQSLDSEWGPARRASAVAEILDPADEAADAVRLLHRPTGRWRVLAPVAASVAVIAVVLGLLAVDRTGGDDTPPAVGPGPAVTSATPTDDRVGPHQYTVRAIDLYTARGTAHPLRHDGHDLIAVNPAGDDWSKYSDGGRCTQFPFSGTTNLGNPTQAFFDSLPTDPVTLEQYMRSHVSGSTSVDEAVFVAVGDALRNDDGLASSAVRTALVEVLARTGHVTVRTGVRDQLGRSATRAVFVDHVRRPGQVSSLYFAPDTGRLLEERNSGTGNGGQRIVGTEVTTSERTVDALPRSLRHCSVNHDH